MDFWRRNTKRILTDAAGYGLLILALLSSPLPGPGGIPIALAGLAVLSIHNEWARRLREYLLKHGGELVKILFPKHPAIQWLYDVLVIVLLVAAGWLAKMHAAIWQISLAIVLFFIAVFLALMNRERLARLRMKPYKP